MVGRRRGRDMVYPESLTVAWIEWPEKKPEFQGVVPEGTHPSEVWGGCPGELGRRVVGSIDEFIEELIDKKSLLARL